MNPQLASLLQQNRLQEARSLCERLCNSHPQDAETRFMMSAICGHLGDFSNSEKYCEQAIAIEPNVPEAHFNLGIARMRLDKKEAAINSFLRAIELRELFPEANNELGTAYHMSGNSELAIEYYKRALRQQPHFAQALCNLGTAQLEMNELDNAEISLQAAITEDPNLPVAYLQLAALQRIRGMDSSATENLQRAYSLAPADVDINLALAENFAKIDKPVALEHCRQALAGKPNNIRNLSRLGMLLKDLGQNEVSIQCYRKALNMKSDDARLLSSLGVGLTAIGQIEEAITMHRKAIELEPGLSGAYFNLGCTLSSARRYTEAEVALGKAVQLNPDTPDAWNNLGTLQMLQGRIEEAISSFDNALVYLPMHRLAASNRLYAMNNTTARTQKEVFAAHRAWGKAAEERALVHETPRPRQVDRDILHIGFVSPDFRMQSVAFFFTSLLEGKDKDIRIHCYSNTVKIDSTTEYIRKRVYKWCDITHLSDEQTADHIRKVGIDVLIDLAGHTSDNRLGVFALSPAPVQITYLGYPNTTGLSVMDYRVTDDIADPPENDPYYTESLLRMNGCFLCYTPMDNAPDPLHREAAKSDPVTFGSFNNLAKISAEMIHVWSDILKAVPGSRLIVKNIPLADAVVADRFMALFQANGVDATRVQLLPWISSIDDHLAAYNRIDIALDTYPYNGTTTTCEALWMDTPVVSRAGSTHASRVGLSLLRAVGMDELVADGRQEYIAIAVALAADLAEFRSRYGNLRERMRRSPLCDRNGFRTRFFSLVKSAAERRH